MVHQTASNLLNLEYCNELGDRVMTDWKAEIQDILDRVSQGDSQAITELVEKFEPEIRVIARRQLGPSLRPYLDSMDIVQSIHRTLFLGLKNEQFQFASPERLFAFVSMLVRRKTARQWRKHRRQQRESGIKVTDDGVSDFMLAWRTRNEATDEVADREEIEQVLSHLEETDRKLITLRMEGCSTAEAARLLKLDPDATRVRLSRLRQRLNQTPLFAKFM